MLREFQVGEGLVWNDDRTGSLGMSDVGLGVGCRPSPVTKAAVQAEYRINGSNQRDTGHWIWSAPPAAMAELLA